MENKMPIVNTELRNHLRPILFIILQNWHKLHISDGDYSRVRKHDILIELCGGDEVAARIISLLEHLFQTLTDVIEVPTSIAQDAPWIDQTEVIKRMKKLGLLKFIYNRDCSLKSIELTTKGLLSLQQGKII